MASPYNYEDTLRIHDLAFYNWMQGLRVDYGEYKGVRRGEMPILAIMASPERAFATVVDLLVAKNWITGADAEEMRENAKEDFAVLPLPLATIYRGDPTPDPELAGAPKVERRKWLNPETGMWEFHPWPGHYRTSYTVTLWSAKKYTAAYMHEFVLAQLGLLGRGNNETLIPVEHREPWGVMTQSLKFEGSSDNSDLEGEQPRYMRYEFSFSLRTWVMRNPEVSAAIINGVGFDKAIPLNDTDYDLRNGTVSDNLWSLYMRTEAIPEMWPRTGNATVKQTQTVPDKKLRFNEYGNGLDITVQEPTDAVELAERVVAVEASPNPYAIMSVAFQYRSNYTVELEGASRSSTDDDLESAYSLLLPAARRWTKVAAFFVVSEQVAALHIVGKQTQPPQEITVVNPDVRQIVSLAKVLPTTTLASGSEVKYEWRGIEPKPFLIVGLLPSANGGDVVTAEDDADTPSFTRTQYVDSTVNVGFALLVQPKASSLALRVPDTLTLAEVFIQEYRGHYAGHDLPTA